MAEREWREASDMRPSRVGLALVLAMAAMLRFWEIGHGVAYAVGPEEPEIVERAFQMMKAGTLNPDFFDYGQLHIFIQLIVSIARFLAGSMSGEWQSLNEAVSTTFYTWGRSVTALFGVVTVLLVFRIGLRWGARQALIAATLMAVLPVHVEYSHYVLPSVLLTFFVTLTMMLSLSAHERPTLRAFGLAGVAVGLSAAMRYSGGLALLMPLVACWMSPSARPSRAACTGAIFAGVLIAFVIGAPYTFLDMPEFLDRVARMATTARQAAPPPEGAGLLYLRFLLIQFAWPGAAGPLTAFGWPALLLIAGGFVMGAIRAVRGPARVPWAIAVTFPAAHFALVAMHPDVQPRYLLPMMPMICILVAAAVISGVSLLRRYEFPRAVRTTMVVLLTVSVLAPPATSGVQVARNLSKVSTQELAYRWLKSHVSIDQLIVGEALSLTLGRADFTAKGVDELWRKTPDAYRNDKAAYLVASSYTYGKYLAAPQQYREQQRAYIHLFSEFEEVARFSPDQSTRGAELRILRVR